MPKFKLACAASESESRFSTSDFMRLGRFAAMDRVKHHTLCDDPSEADYIVFVGSSRPAYRDVRNHELYIRYKNKCALIELSDKAFPIIPGIYPSFSKRWAKWSLGAAASTCYPRVSENTSMDMSALAEESSYLYSFVGSASNHAVRKKILDITDEAAFFYDCSGESQQTDGIEGDNRNRGLFYRDIMKQSKFILCPRGIGPSSWRLFEAMRAGRIPVIISDDWVEPPGPRWHDFSVRIRESNVRNIPFVLRTLESQAAEMARIARNEWEKWYADDVIFNTLMSQILEVMSAFQNRSRFQYAFRNIQAIEPWFLRHWYIGPFVRGAIRSVQNLKRAE